MSGGVDSSVAALLLRDAGYSVSGLFMKNWDEDDGTEYCTAEADLADAQAVADQLGIELHRANFAAEYWDDVFEEFLREYRAGRTPNPDVLCNREIKFRVFREYAEILGAEYTATGHYARLLTVDGRPQLLKGIDTGKDQSYFLHAVPESGFANTLFPLGDMPKDEVRAVAAEHGLPTAAKKDSTGICFIGERRFADFLSTWVRPCPGPVVDEGPAPPGPPRAASEAAPWRLPSPQRSAGSEQRDPHLPELVGGPRPPRASLRPTATSKGAAPGARVGRETRRSGWRCGR